MLQFLSPIEGAALKKHVIKRIPLDSEHSCRVQCYLENTCVSYNFGKSTSGDDVCELNNSTHTEHPYDLKTTRDFNYRGTEVRCFLHCSSLMLHFHSWLSSVNNEGLNGGWSTCRLSVKISLLCRLKFSTFVGCR